MLVLGGIFLIGMMGLTVANVTVRFFGRIIAGTYELTEMMHVVVIACALGFAVIKGGQVSVEILYALLSPRAKRWADGFNSLLSSIFWLIVAGASSEILYERWLDEKTELLGIPFMPFRLIWVCGLIFVSLVLFRTLLEALIGKAEK